MKLSYFQKWQRLSMWQIFCESIFIVPLMSLCWIKQLSLVALYEYGRLIYMESYHSSILSIRIGIISGVSG